MKEAGGFILRIILKTAIIASFVWILVYVVNVVKSEHYVKKEMLIDSVSPVTRDCKPNYNITEDTLFLKRLERDRKELMK